MRFLYLLRATRLEMLIEAPTPEEQAIVADHLEHLTGLAAQGVVHHIGRTANADERTLGVVVFEADDTESAERIVASDPAVRGGVMRAELLPYRQVYPA